MFNFRCWHGDTFKRPTINEIFEFFSNTEMQRTNFGNFPATDAQSKNAQKVTAASKRGYLPFYFIKAFLASNNHESLYQPLFKKPNFHIPNPIETNIGNWVFAYF